MEDRKNNQSDWEINLNPVPGMNANAGGDDESPTLKKLKDLNKKYYSDKLDKKK